MFPEEMNCARLILSVVALLLCLEAVAATKTKLIDEDGVESIAQAVCSRSMGSPQAQIGSVSTIYQLVAFFDNLQSDHELRACRDTNSPALHLLYDIVSTRNDDACSDEKISLIEKFHHRYISKTKKDRKQQKLDNAKEVPQLLKSLFYHYATQVATTCKSSLVARMDQAASGERGLRIEGDAERVDLFLADFSKQMGSTSGSLKTYDEISLLWNFIDRLPAKATNNYISQEGKRIAFETKDPNNMRAFQRECSTRLKPVYGASALPVIRLIDLGYYLDDEPFAAELAERADLRRLIGVAQVCEFLLPIRIIANDKLAEGEMLLLTKERAREIPSGDDADEAAEPIVVPDDVRSSLMDLNALSTVTPEGAHQFVKSINSNIEMRERTLRIVFNRMARSVMDKAKSLFGKIFYLRKDPEGAIVKRDTAEIEGKKFDLLKELKRLGKTVWSEFNQDIADFVELTYEFGLLVILVLPLVLLKWIVGGLIATFYGIFLALYAVVGAPLVNLFNSPEAQSHGNTKSIFNVNLIGSCFGLD